jgi:hypothetical protein
MRFFIPRTWQVITVFMGMGLQRALYLITNIEPLTVVRASLAASVRVSAVTAGSACVEWLWPSVYVGALIETLWFRRVSSGGESAQEDLLEQEGERYGVVHGCGEDSSEGQIPVAM